MKHKIEEYKLCYYWAKAGKQVAIARLPIVKSDIMKLRKKQKAATSTYDKLLELHKQWSSPQQHAIDYGAVDDELDRVGEYEGNRSCSSCRTYIPPGLAWLGKYVNGADIYFRFCAVCHTKLKYQGKITGVLT